MNGMIALIAHDGTGEDEMLRAGRGSSGDLLDEEAVVASTATTGSVLRCELELDVRCVLSGPLGGDLQIGSMVAGGFRSELVIFLRDPLTPNPHDPDIHALMKVCGTSSACRLRRTPPPPACASRRWRRSV